MEKEPTPSNPGADGVRAAKEESELREAMKLTWEPADAAARRWRAELPTGGRFEIIAAETNLGPNFYLFTVLPNDSAIYLGLIDGLEQAKRLASLIDVRRLEIEAQASRPVYEDDAPEVPKEKS